ncbi:MAG: SurA N-terminal domain-containing protein [Hyphomicrobiales bacterium]
MLRGIHKASSTWLGRIVLAVIMGLIVVSFAIWGIGDIFRGFGLSTVATIGRTEISIEQFRNYYNERLQQLGRRLNRPITPDQARALGLERQLIGQLVAETTLDERARELRLNISETEIAARITSDPNFIGPTGQFDRFRFEQTIRQNGFTEARYVAEQRRVLLRRAIAGSLTDGLKIPNTALTAIDRFRNEQRNIEYATLGPAQAGDVSKPTPEMLAKYFDERKILFRAPEYRKLTLIVLSPADQARWATISDADAKKVYEDNRDSYGTPEQRQVRQIVFPNADEARAASERIAKGLTFSALATERKLKESDTDIGLVAKTAIIDPAIANAAFALKQNEVSSPVQGRFGTVILQVTKIEPAKMPTYEEMSAQIKRDLAASRAKSDMLSLHDKIEDGRAGGSSLAEVAQKLNVTSRTIESIDRSGRDPDGTPVTGLPAGVDVISSAFASDVGVENDPLQLPGNGYVWYEVGGIVPAHDRKLEEVKEQVETRWRDDEIAARLKSKADDMVAKLKTGAKFAELASANGVKLATATGLQRGKSVAAVSPKAIESAFRIAKAEPVSADGVKPNERVVLRVTEVIEPKLDTNSDEAKRLIETLRGSIADDLIGEYIARLEAQMGVTINQAALAQVVGGSNNSN